MRGPSCTTSWARRMTNEQEAVRLYHLIWFPIYRRWYTEKGSTQKMRSWRAPSSSVLTTIHM